MTTTASVSQTYYTQEGVDEANQDCTEPLFSINKAILSENIEKSCPELAEDSNFPTVGDSFYNIYKVENNKLFFGNSSEAPTDAQNRPTAIDDTVAYSKQ